MGTAVRTRVETLAARIVVTSQYPSRLDERVGGSPLWRRQSAVGRRVGSGGCNVAGLLRLHAPARGGQERMGPAAEDGNKKMVERPRRFEWTFALESLTRWRLAMGLQVGGGLQCFGMAGWAGRHGLASRLGPSEDRTVGFLDSFGA